MVAGFELNPEKKEERDVSVKIEKPEEAQTTTQDEPEEETTGKRSITPKEIVTGIGFVGLLLGFVYLTMNGILQDAAVAAAELGTIGHVIFIILYIFVAMPFGWGYSVVIVAAAFSFGMEAILTAEIGTLVGAFLSYMLCKHLLSHWVRKNMLNLKPKTQRTLLAIELALRHGKGGLGMQIGLRVNPVLPYGWTNAVLGVWEVAPLNFLCSTMLGCQVDIVLKTNVGLLLKTAGDLNKQTPETKKLVQTQLMIQCCVFVVVLAAGTLYSRWIMKNVMPKDEDGTEGGPALPTLPMALVSSTRSSRTSRSMQVDTVTLGNPTGDKKSPTNTDHIVVEECNNNPTQDTDTLNQ